ncbi:glycosyltransferase family 87 protein [Neorhizobium petrolearium]|uniref:glycosyltransferase family 87 protein n=1 Tax=Neorhizobium petrolearium TaxID=515361 RepID=UPI003F192839
MAAILKLSVRPLQPIMALLLGFFAIWAIWVEAPRVLPDHGLWDFGAFVASGRAAASGLDPYGVYPPLTPHVVFPGFESWNPNLNPPVSALLFQAFDLAEPTLSFRVWRWISIGCYAAAVFLLLRRYTSGSQTLLLGIWAAGLAGFWDTLYLGQIYTPLVLFAVIAWLQLERGNSVLAGIMIGLLVSMKPNFLVWPVLLFLAGYRLPSLVAAATGALVALIPLAAFGPQIYFDWLRLVASDGDRAIFLTNASFSGLAARAGIPLLGTIVSGVLLLGLAVWACRERPSIIEISSFGLLAALLASPLGWIQYTLFLLPVLLHYRQNVWAFLPALLLTIPVPFVLTYFGASAVVQLTAGSIYGWALFMLLIGLIIQGRGTQNKRAQSR